MRKVSLKGTFRRQLDAFWQLRSSVFLECGESTDISTYSLLLSVIRILGLFNKCICRQRHMFDAHYFMAEHYLFLLLFP